MEMRQYGFQLRWIDQGRAYEWLSMKSEFFARHIYFEDVPPDGP